MNSANKYLFVFFVFFVIALMATSCGDQATSTATPVKDESQQKQLAEKLYGKEIDFDKGKKLFKRHCAVCHSLTNTKLTGPGLQGLNGRIPSGEWLKHFLSNPDSMYKTKDPYIEELKKENPYNAMSSFKQLSPQEMKDLIAFIHTQ